MSRPVVVPGPVIPQFRKSLWGSAGASLLEAPLLLIRAILSPLHLGEDTPHLMPLENPFFVTSLVPLLWAGGLLEWTGEWFPRPCCIWGQPELPHRQIPSSIIYSSSLGDGPALLGA